jgi:hypothetical protein
VYTVVGGGSFILDFVSCTFSSDAAGCGPILFWGRGEKSRQKPAEEAETHGIERGDYGHVDETLELMGWKCKPVNYYLVSLQLDFLFLKC